MERTLQKITQIICSASWFIFLFVYGGGFWGGIIYLFIYTFLSPSDIMQFSKILTSGMKTLK